MKIVVRMLILALLLGAIYYVNDPEPKSQERVNRFVVKPDILKHMVLGQRLLVADFFWIRLVQELDYSENKGKPISRGWSFHMLDAVTELDPRYWMAYRAGLTVLSVLVQDIEGAKVLFERAIKIYPEDWPLHYRAAYHFLYEVKDCKRAAELLTIAAELGAPQWVVALAGKLYTWSGQKELARTVISDALNRFKGHEYEEHLQKRLKEIEGLEKKSSENLCSP